MSFSFALPNLKDWTGLGATFSGTWHLVGFLSFLLLLLVSHSLLPHLWVLYKKEQAYRRLPSPATSPILGRILGHLEVYWNAPAQVKKRSPSESKHCPHVPYCPHCPTTPTTLTTSTASTSPNFPTTPNCPCCPYYPCCPQLPLLPLLPHTAPTAPTTATTPTAPTTPQLSHCPHVPTILTG